MRIEDTIKALVEGIKTEPEAAVKIKQSNNSIMKSQNTTASLMKVTDKDVEKALNTMVVSKAVQYLISKSPIKLTHMQDIGDLSVLGYLDTGMRSFHLGAPITFESTDGGTITIYDGKGSAKMGEDQKKIVYENGRFKQEMFYDDSGVLVQGKITIRDEAAGFIEQELSFRVKDNQIVK